MAKKITILLTFLFLFQGFAKAQVTFNPRAIFIDSKKRTAVAQVINNYETAQELEFEFKFMYETFSDSLKRVVIVKDDSVNKEKYDIGPYLRLFPRKLIIPPKKQQVIRLLVSNDAALPHGTYWTRVAVTATKVQEAIDTTGKNAPIGAGLKLFTNLTFPVIYQKGSVETGIEVENFRVFDFDENYYQAEFTLKRTGNSPFWGSISAAIFKKGEDELLDKRHDPGCPVYFEETRSLLLDKNMYEPGQYYMVLALQNDGMTDIPEEFKYNDVDYEEEFDFTIP